MVLEVADITVRPGQEDAFVAAYTEGVTQIRASAGFRSIRIVRGIESPAPVGLLVEWDDLEAHTVGFRESQRFTRWRAAIGPYLDGAPRVEHFADVPVEP